MSFTSTNVAKVLVKKKKLPKGKASEYFEFKNVDPAAKVAVYFGFFPLPGTLVVSREDREKAKELGEADRNRCNCPLLPVLEEKVAVFRYYEEKKLSEAPQPVMLCTELNPGAGMRRKQGEKHLSLEIIGTTKSIADATLIQTSLSILKEEGYEEVCVFINSVGDRESGSRFVRELTGHYRKNIAALPQTCKMLLKKNPVELLECSHDKCRVLANEAPRSVGFLGEESRRHFKEVLEYLEELEIPYRMDPVLVGNRSFATETVFEIRDMREGRNMERLAAGCRYNHLGKRLGLRRDTPSVGVTILLRREKEASASQLRLKKPCAFFLQIGFEAKLRSLRVIETLRQAGIPLYQALSHDKLVAQLSTTENLKIPYSIIMGQREALEDAVIVRHTATRVQETVKIAELSAYFKKLKLA